jgi:hypothetical protein
MQEILHAEKPKQELPAALAAKMWQKGQSGNPGGRGSEWHRCQSLCREASFASVEELMRLRDHSDDDRVRYMAATWLYERAWGKIKEYDPKSEEQPLPFDPSKLTPGQFNKLRAAMQMLIQAMGDDTT